MQGFLDQLPATQTPSGDPAPAEEQLRASDLPLPYRELSVLAVNARRVVSSTATSEMPSSVTAAGSTLHRSGPSDGSPRPRLRRCPCRISRGSSPLSFSPRQASRPREGCAPLRWHLVATNAFARTRRLVVQDQRRRPRRRRVATGPTYICAGWCRGLTPRGRYVAGHFGGGGTS